MPASLRPHHKLNGTLAGALVCFIAAGLIVGDTLQAASPSGTNRPNIVLVMCDDMGFSDIGCYGGEIRTPNIDRLAAEGLRFTQFYNNAKCTTTRASLLTGLYPRQDGKLLRQNMVTVAELLADAGYQTILSGKWHLGQRKPRRPSDRGFQKYFGLLDGCCNFFDPSIPDPEFKGGRVRVVAQDDVRITSFPADFYMTDAISDYAVDAIDRATSSDDPFFLHVCYTAPHYPLHAKPEDIARYQGQYLDGWESLRKQRHERQVALGIIDPRWTLPSPDPEVADWNSLSNKPWQDLRMAVYAAMIDSMDQGIGRMLRKLDEEGIADETLVLFLSDNGGCAEIPGGEDVTREPGPKQFYTTCGPGWAYAQNTPFRRYKQWVHEGGISTPLIVRWPNVVKPNSITHDVGHIIDLLPTCIDLASVDYPTRYQDESIIPVEGLSLRPILEGNHRDGHKTLFWEWNRSRAGRQGKWKLCWDRKVEKWELYDLVADRTETNDLAVRHPQKSLAMQQEWFKWAERTGVSFDKASR